ncbi:MAG TPA: DNA alkylation repair protein [Marinagarivorans sp.]
MKHALSQQAVERIAAGLSAVVKSFDSENFKMQACTGLEKLTLKARVSHIIAAIHTQLPDFKAIAPALCELPHHWDSGNPEAALRGFAAWPIIDFVAVHGIKHPLPAYQALEHLTPLFSAEFAIRPFIEKYPDLTFKQLGVWAAHSNEHVRRLASEGCRPRLPWGIKLRTLVANPAPILPILEALKNDPSLYVRKSVANNFNDISKDHPETVLSRLESWQNNASKETQWIIRHASRTLIKQGHPRSLALLGAHEASINHVELKLRSQKIKPEGDLAFSVSFISQKKQKLVIDYAIDFIRANGQHNSKVFKLKTLEADQGQVVTLSKRYSFKTITTRRYYSGQQRVHIQVNGKRVASQSFELKPA